MCAVIPVSIRCYESGQTGFQDSDIEYTCSVNPAFLKTKINTIQDAICYFQASGFRCQDAPVLVTGKSNWIWTLPGAAVLWYGGGGSSEFANAASYLLQYDFEDWGFILKYGEGSGVCNRFYEDGTFYIIDFTRVISDNRDNVQNSPESYMMMSFGADSPESEKELLDQFLECNTNYEHCFVSFWVEATGYDFQPATVLSWCHEGPYNADNKYIALEKEVLEERTIIGYVNPDVECDIKGIDIDLIPSIVPTYGTRSNQDEIDRWNRYYRY